MTTIKLGNGTRKSFRTSEEARAFIINEGKRAKLRAEMAKTNADKIRHLQEARNLFNWAKADKEMDAFFSKGRNHRTFEIHCAY